MSTKTTHPSLDARFADVALELGEWIGSVLPGLDLALAEIGDGDWKPGTREAVLHWVGIELISEFDDLRPATTEQLDVDARAHLARYAIARARAHVIRSRQDLACTTA